MYLSDSEAEGLRRAAARSRRSQSELIREGIQLVTAREGADRRVFHSMGSGSGDGPREVRWDSDKLYRGLRGGASSVASDLGPALAAPQDPWGALTGWLDDQPVDDIDQLIYGGNG